MISNSVQYRKATSCIIIIVLYFLLFIPFPWRKTQLFTRQSKVQLRKTTLITPSIKEKMPTLAGNKHLSIHFFLHGPRPFHLSTEKIRVQSVRTGHQSGYSRADTMKSKKQRSKKFCTRGN